MVKVGVVPSATPVSDGAMGSDARWGGITTGSRAGGAGGRCAQAPSSNAAQPTIQCRASVVMGVPLAELILPRAQHAEDLGGILKTSPRMGFGSASDGRVVATQKGIDADL